MDSIQKIFALWYIHKVIKSCTTIEQYQNAIKMFDNISVTNTEPMAVLSVYNLAKEFALYHKRLITLNQRRKGKSMYFYDVDEFFAWFNKDFKGRIIHWTDLKY